MVFAEQLTNFGLVRYLLKGEMAVSVVNTKYAIGLSGVIAHADGMFINACLELLNPRAGL